MARHAPSDPPPPALRVSPLQAAERIEERIRLGEELLRQMPTSDEELEEAQGKRRIWSDYNTLLLTQLFTSSAIANEYSWSAGFASIPLQPSLADGVNRWRESIRESLTRLRSMLQRLELFPTSSGVAPGPGGEGIRGTGIFIVHGRKGEPREKVARFLEHLGLNVTILHELPDRGRAIIEKLVEDSAQVGFAVILLTGDDIGRLQEDPPDAARPRARQNVIFEHGYFMGALGRGRVCALREEDVEIPSDLAGALYIPLDSGGGWQLRVVKELKAAGINVDMNLVAQ